MAYYAQVITQQPELSQTLNANLVVARRNYRASRQGIEKPRVAVCSWDLAQSAGRAYTLVQLYETFAEVELIGCLFPSFGREIWEPLRDISIAKHHFIIEDESRFIAHAITLVADHPYDIVHLSKPRAPNLIFGLLYKLLWDAQVLMDIDDEELAYVGAETPIRLDDLLQHRHSWPAMHDLAGKDWTRIAVGLATAFDGVTVSSPALQQRYGGEIVRHARDERLDQPTPVLKRQSRAHYGIPQDKTVVLFFGTPRAHKGLIETAEALAAFGRQDLLFAVVGDLPDPELKDRLQSIPGLDCRFIGNQPIPAVTAIGDLCLLLQDPQTAGAQFKVLAKLSDALAMGLPVLATETPALADAYMAGAFWPVTPEDLAKSLAQVLDDPATAARLQAAGRRYFMAELAGSVNRPRLQQAVAQATPRPLRAAFASLAPALGAEWLYSLVSMPNPGDKARRVSTPVLHAAGQGVVQKVAVVAHVYYPELWPDIAARLRGIRYPFDLFVTTTTDDAAQVTSAIQADFPAARLEVQPNRGMDVWPFLALAPKLAKAGYLAVCKLHTKGGEDEPSRHWRALMLDALVGDDATFSQIVEAFAAHPELQLVGPACLYLSARRLMLDNAPALSDLSQQLEGRSLPTTDWGFFAGRMFWVRPELLLPLATHLARMSHAFETSVQKDGQLAHAIERFFGLLPALDHGQIGLLHPNAGTDTGEHGGYGLQRIVPLVSMGQASIGLLLDQQARLAEDRARLDASGLFDTTHYLDQCPSLTGLDIDLLTHYLLIGRFQDQTPHPDFDPVFYRQAHANRLKGGENPFLHYLRTGAQTGLRLHPSQTQAQAEIPSFRYQALNSALIDWHAEASKARDPQRVSIIIPVLDQPELTRACIAALYQHTPAERFEVVVVDNGSAEPTRLLLETLARQHDNLRLVRNAENLHFSLGCNLGFAASHGERVIFLNNDTRVTAGWFEPLIAPLDRPETSAVQPCLLSPDGRIQCIGVVFSLKSPLGYPIYAEMTPEEAGVAAGRSRAFQAVTGACMAVRAADVARVRGFDPVFINGQEDVDFCLRLNAGGKRSCWYAAEATVYHEEAKTEGHGRWIERNRGVFVRRWLGRGRIDLLLAQERLKNGLMSNINKNKSWYWRAMSMRSNPVINSYDLILFCEQRYLDAYPDVQHVVDHGLMTAYEHWITSGFYEEESGVRSGEWRPSTNRIYLKKNYPKCDDIHSLLNSEIDKSINSNKAYFLNNLRQIHSSIRKLPRKPLISLLLPTYNISKKWLDAAIESVFFQVYENWELCIVDDCSTVLETRKTIKKWADKDKRIKVFFRKSNGHISAASNDAFAMSTGDFVGLLDHDDELTLDALARVVYAINEYPGVDYMYSDEDKIDQTHKCFGRFFKPAWSPEFLLSCGYTTHLSVYRRKLLESLGGFRSEFDGAQDYDLTLRASELTDKIIHIPYVLYHWRTLPSSTANTPDAKNYALASAKRALTSHLDRTRQLGKVGDAPQLGWTKVEFDIKEPLPLVSIIIPTAGKTVTINNNSVNLIKNCVSSIFKSTYPRLQIIVIENGDLSNQTNNYLSNSLVELVPYRKNKFNLAEKMNLGYYHARGEYLIFLNDDIEVINEDWIEQMLMYAQRSNVGCVGAKLLFPDKTIQHLGVSIINKSPGHPHYRKDSAIPGHAGMARVPHNVIAVTGACLMTPKTLFNQLGKFDEEFDLNYNDVDYCLKAAQIGYRSVITPNAILWHYESVSRDNAGSVTKEELEKFQAKYPCLVKQELFVRTN